MRAFDGRLVFTGEATATMGREDHEAYFNYTDYERNALRTIRLSLGALWQPADRVAFVGGDWRTSTTPARRRGTSVWPFREHRFDLQAGRIPPVFGAFGRRVYSSDRFLIGYPLTYQHLTSLRADSVPANADDLLFRAAAGGDRASRSAPSSQARAFR